MGIMQKVFLIVLVMVVFTNCSKKEEAPFAATVEESSDNSSSSGSYSSNYQYSESSTNDPSNDQPVGTYGDQTMTVSTPHNGAQYTLDVEFNGDNPSTIYFPKGGHVEISDCSRGGGSWECTDEDGKAWTIEK